MQRLLITQVREAYSTSAVEVQRGTAVRLCSVFCDTTIAVDVPDIFSNAIFLAICIRLHPKPLISAWSDVYAEYYAQTTYQAITIHRHMRVTIFKPQFRKTSISHVN